MHCIVLTRKFAVKIELMRYNLINIFSSIVKNALWFDKTGLSEQFGVFSDKEPIIMQKKG